MSYYDNRPRFFTDGACRRNGQSDSSGACAYYLNEGCKKSWTDPTTPSTNQSCELGAIYGAIRRAWHCDFQSIVVCTDSEYSINCLTLWPDNNWRPNADDDGTWRNNRGWPVANQDLIKKILANMENVEVEFEHVYAHTGIDGNERADQMARDALDGNFEYDESDNDDNVSECECDECECSDAETCRDEYECDCYECEDECNKMC